MKLRIMLSLLALAASNSSCQTVSDAAESLRWTTPHDQTKQTKALTETIADARQSLHKDHEQLINGDKEGLARSGQEAKLREDERIAALQLQLDAQEKAWNELKSSLKNSLVGMAPGPVGEMISMAFQRTTTAVNDGKIGTDQVRSKAEAAATQAAQATAAAVAAKTTADDASAEQKKTTTRLVNAEEKLAALDAQTKAALEKINELTATRKALEKLSQSQLDELAAFSGDRTKFDQRIAEYLKQHGVPQTEIDKFKASTDGLSTTEILALLGALAGGAGLGTYGGRRLSRSGERLAEQKTELNELYDEISGLKVRIAKCCDCRDAGVPTATPPASATPPPAGG